MITANFGAFCRTKQSQKDHKIVAEIVLWLAHVQNRDICFRMSAKGRRRSIRSQIGRGHVKLAPPFDQGLSWWSVRVPVTRTVTI